jgi:hypothetical protein
VIKRKIVEIDISSSEVELICEQREKQIHHMFRNAFEFSSSDNFKDAARNIKIELDNYYELIKIYFDVREYET